MVCRLVGHWWGHYFDTLSVGQDNSFEDQTPVDKIIAGARYFKSGAVTSLWRHQMETLSALLAFCAVWKRIGVMV